MRNLIALMPIKAHSSRVPNKNFRVIAGKPLFQWMLDTLLELEFVDYILINTDAKEHLLAAGLVESDRVILKTRSDSLVGDDVSMNLILEDDLNSNPASMYLMTHTTNPALSSDTLRGAYKAFLHGIEDGYDSLFSVNKHQARFYSSQVSPINHDPANLIPTQDLEPWYEENSCLYYFTREAFGENQARIGAKPLMFETPSMESVDIDEWKDWHLAEAILKMESK